jgi:hypothetical protein
MGCICSARANKERNSQPNKLCLLHSLHLHLLYTARLWLFVKGVLRAHRKGERSVDKTFWTKIGATSCCVEWKAHGLDSCRVPHLSARQ